jgi:uncharacterized protein YaaR (DUF327 family)
MFLLRGVLIMSKSISAVLEGSGYNNKDQKWVSYRIQRLPLSFKSKVEADYVKLAETKSFREANSLIRELYEEIRLKGTSLLATCSNEAIKQYAEIISKRLETDFGDFMRRTGNQDFSVQRIISEVEKRGLTFPLEGCIECTVDEKIAALARVFNPRWWVRRLRKIKNLKLELVARHLDMVHKRGQVYCSNISVSNRREQKQRNTRMIEGLEAISDEGDVLSLAECVEASVANPENRRAELMVRMRGFEEVANHAGHQGVFFTLTAPSKYHAIHASGKPNNKYQGATPKETNDYLGNLWTKVRSAWDRRGIKPYGFRVVEPHHDGTPHWHLMLFFEPATCDEAINKFRDYAIADDRAELRNNLSARFDTKLIDPKKGSATGYIAKYISKNINGYGVDLDHESGTDAQDSAVRVDAWAALFGIRQFQQIGGPQVSIWRELRRVSEKEANEWFYKSDEQQPESIKQARSAADASNWKAFVTLMGGPSCKRKDQTLQLHKVIRRTECGLQEENDYGEIISRVRGVIDRVKGKATMLLTRTKRWSVRRAEHDSVPQVAPWSSVNNCTEGFSIGEPATH